MLKAPCTSPYFFLTLVSIWENNEDKKLKQAGLVRGRDWLFPEVPVIFGVQFCKAQVDEHIWRQGPCTEKHQMSAGTLMEWGKEKSY